MDEPLRVSIGLDELEELVAALEAYFGLMLKYEPMLMALMPKEFGAVMDRLNAAIAAARDDTRVLDEGGV